MRQACALKRAGLSDRLQHAGRSLNGIRLNQSAGSLIRRLLQDPRASSVTVTYSASCIYRVLLTKRVYREKSHSCSRLWINNTHTDTHTACQGVMLRAAESGDRLETRPMAARPRRRTARVYARCRCCTWRRPAAAARWWALRARDSARQCHIQDARLSCKKTHAAADAHQKHQKAARIMHAAGPGLL